MNLIKKNKKMICSKLGIPGRIYTAAVCFCDFKACPFATDFNGSGLVPKLCLWPPQYKM